MVKEQGLLMEEVYLPLNATDSLRRSLAQTNKILPSSATKFRDWDVALLQRFDVNEEIP